MSYDYTNDLQHACRLLPKLEGALIQTILINVVEPEFNVVFLKTDVGDFQIHGKIGSEYLGIEECKSFPEVMNEDGYIICSYPPFAVFEGKRITQARQIGTVWNGHGFEFSFDGIHDKTMIIQSIYTGEKPEGYDDCLRLGIGTYAYSFSKST